MNEPDNSKIVSIGDDFPSTDRAPAVQPPALGLEKPRTRREGRPAGQPHRPVAHGRGPTIPSRPCDELADQQHAQGGRGAAPPPEHRQARGEARLARKAVVLTDFGVWFDECEAARLGRIAQPVVRPMCGVGRTPAPRCAQAGRILAPRPGRLRPPTDRPGIRSG
jgi:hypothetical protein